MEQKNDLTQLTQLTQLTPISTAKISARWWVVTRWDPLGGLIESLGG